MGLMPEESNWDSDNLPARSFLPDRQIFDSFVDEKRINSYTSVSSQMMRLGLMIPKILHEIRQ